MDNEKEITRMAIGLTIRELRTSKGLTVEQLANLMEKTKGTVSRWENAKIRITTYDFLQLTKKLDVNFNIANDIVDKYIEQLSNRK